MPITADPPIIIAQYFEPEAKTDLVTESTVDPTAQFHLPTATGINDNRMMPNNVVTWLSGLGITNVGGKYTLDIAGLTSESAQVGTDEMALQTAGGLRSMTRDDFLSGIGDPTELTPFQGPAQMDTVSSTAIGPPATYAMASGIVAGPLSAADWTRFDTAATTPPASTDLGHIVNGNVSIDITSSTGNPTTIAVAGSLSTGFLSSADWNLFNNTALHTGPITSDAAGLTTIGTNVVTYANVQQSAAQTILANPSAGSQNVQATASLPGSVVDPGSVVMGWNSGGALVQFDVGDIQSATSRKEIQDDLGDVSGPTVIDFDLGNGDNKIIRMTADTDVTLTATRPGDYQIWIGQDNVGSRAFSIATPTEPSGNPSIQQFADTKSILKLVFDDDSNWHWG